MTAPGHRRGAAVTEHILSTATELIVERGDLSFSIEQLAERAGVDKTTVYRRWSTVPSLVADAILSRAEAAVPLTSTGDVRHDLQALCRAVVDNLTSPIGRALMTASHASADPELVGLRTAFWRQRLTEAADLLGDLVRAGESGDQLIEWLVAPLHFRIVERGLDVDRTMIETLVDHFLAGLDARRP